MTRKARHLGICGENSLLPCSPKYQGIWAERRAVSVGAGAILDMDGQNHKMLGMTGYLLITRHAETPFLQSCFRPSKIGIPEQHALVTR